MSGPPARKASHPMQPRTTDEIRAKAIQGWLSLTASRVFQAVIGLLSLAALFRYFGPEQMGIFAIANSLFNFLLPLNIGTGPAIQTFLSEFEERKWMWSLRTLLKISMLLRLGFLALISAALYLGAGWGAEFFQMPFLATLLPLFAVKNLSAILAGPFDSHTMLGLRHYRGVFVYNILSALGNAGAILAVIVVQGGLRKYVVFLILGSLPASASAWVFFLRARCKFAGPRLPEEDSAPRLVAKLLRFGLPTMFHQFLGQVHFYAANLIAGKFLGTTPTGYISFATGLINRLDDFLKPFSTVMLPVFSKLKVRGKGDLYSAYRKNHDITVYGGFLVSLFVVAFAKEITLLLGGAQYLVGGQILALISIQFLFRLPIHPIAQLNYALNLPHINFACHAFKIAIELILYAVLTPLWGLWGLAFSITGAWWLASYFLEFYAYRLLLSPDHWKPFVSDQILRFWLILISILVLIFGVQELLAPILDTAVRICIVLLAAWFVDRRLSLFRWSRVRDLRTAFRSLCPHR